MDSFCEAIRVLALIRLDDLAKSEDKLRSEAELLAKHKSELDEIIAGKGIDQLEELEREIDKILTGDQFTLDIDYWDFLLMMVKRQRAIIVLRNFLDEFKKHSRNKKNQSPADDLVEAKPELTRRLNLKDEMEVSIPYEDEESELCDDECTEIEFMERLSKERSNIINNYIDGFISDLVEENVPDKEKATKYTQHILALVNDESNNKPTNHDGQSDVFSSLYSFHKPSKTNEQFQWIDEYKPRKPHYFNRVKLGYEWSKINQAHYTVDNPPPREVVGYKFNIFYPNLLDSSKTPSFKLFPTESPELVIITFSAGPPYEDISFRLVNKQWDMADRKNFKCIFDRGVLCLYFDFVKNRYRR